MALLSQKCHLSTFRTQPIMPAASPHVISSRPSAHATQPEIVWLPSEVSRTLSAACSSRHGLRRSRLLVVREAGGGMDPQDPLTSLFQSPVFQNSAIVKEFNSVVSDMMGLSKMASKFAEFDVVGKRMYIEKMREASDRYEVFIKRLELSDDPASREYLRITNAQMLNGGFTLRAMFEGLRGSLGQYEQLVVAEEAAIAAGPAQHQEYLKAFRGVWQQTALGALDLGDLSSKIPPEVLLRAQKDPQFWKCIKEISDTPTPEVMSRWMESETLGPLVSELARSLLTQQAKRQAQ